MRWVVKTTRFREVAHREGMRRPMFQWGKKIKVHDPVYYNPFSDAPKIEASSVRGRSAPLVLIPLPAELDNQK